MKGKLYMKTFFIGHVTVNSLLEIIHGRANIAIIPSGERHSASLAYLDITFIVKPHDETVCSPGHALPIILFVELSNYKKGSASSIEFLRMPVPYDWTGTKPP